MEYNVVCIWPYGLHGQVNQAMQLYEEMLALGNKADVVTCHIHRLTNDLQPCRPYCEGSISSGVCGQLMAYLRKCIMCVYIGYA